MTIRLQSAVPPVAALILIFLVLLVPSSAAAMPLGPELAAPGSGQSYNCPGVQNSPNFTFAYGDILVDEVAAASGTVVEARSPSGDTVGCFTVSQAGVYGLMYVYGQDISVSPPIPGMQDGQTVKFYVDGVLASVSPALVWHNDKSPHQAGLTAAGATPCYSLIRSHSGSGADPSATPANSTGCAAGQYHAGEVISLTASPSSGWQIASWTGTDNDASTLNTNQVTMPAAPRSVSANYSQTPIPCYALTRSHGGSGSDPSAMPTYSTGCATGQYHAGEVINLTASPAGGWQVTSWTGTDNDGSAATANQVTMPAAAHTVSVSYAVTPNPCYTLTLSHTGQGGDPTATPASSTGCAGGQYHAGEVIGLTASPSTGWQVAGWSGTDDDASASTANHRTMPGANHWLLVAYQTRMYLPHLSR